MSKDGEMGSRGWIGGISRKKLAAAKSKRGSILAEKLGGGEGWIRMGRR